MFDYWVSSRMDFNMEDKRDCFETVKTIVELAQKARVSGLLSLQQEVESSQDHLLRTAVHLLCDSVESEDIRKILQNWIISGNYRGRRLFKRILIMEGMLAIKQGAVAAFLVKSLLASYFGEYMMPEYTAYMKSAGFGEYWQ